MNAVRNFERTLWPRLPGSAAPGGLVCSLRFASLMRRRRGAAAGQGRALRPHKSRNFPDSPAFLGLPENYVKDLTEKLGGVGVDIACAIRRISDDEKD